MKKEDLNIMANMKMIEELKANLLCIIGELYSLLARGSSAAQDAILRSEERRVGKECRL